MRVLERRAGGGSLVHDQVRRRPSLGRDRAHPLAPAFDRDRQLVVAESAAIDVSWRGVFTITSCEPSAGCEPKSPTSAVRRESARGSAALEKPPRVGARALAAAEHRVEVRHRAHAPAGRVRLAAAGPVGPDLGRRAVLAALAERALLGRVGLRLGDGGREGVGALGPPGREHDSQPGELVDAYLGSGQAAVPKCERCVRCLTPALRRRSARRGRLARIRVFELAQVGRRHILRADRRRHVGGIDGRCERRRLSLACGTNAFSRSIGSGKTIVVFWFTPISRSVCR